MLNSYLVIARSYYDETLQKSMAQTLRVRYQRVYILSVRTLVFYRETITSIYCSNTQTCHAYV